jgi:DNA-binding protein HU-beta
MNKAELISAIAERGELTKADARRALDALIEVTGETLKGGDKLTLLGFGTFSTVERGARTGRNPRTGKEIKIAARKAVKFTPGKELKGTIN